MLTSDLCIPESLGRPPGMSFLQGKNAVITGSSMGIGKAVALEFAEQGANLVLNSSSSQNALEDVLHEVQRGEATAVASVGSVADEAFATSLVDRCVEGIRSDRHIGQRGRNCRTFWFIHFVYQHRRLAAANRRSSEWHLFYVPSRGPVHGPAREWKYRKYMFPCLAGKLWGYRLRRR